jgi:hypothetical protein
MGGFVSDFEHKQSSYGVSSQFSVRAFTDY